MSRKRYQINKQIQYINNMDSKEKKRCFIITPIGNEGSEIRKKADGIIDAVIKPILDDLDYDVYIPHKMNNPGSITSQVIDHILNDELVIANLTGLNANVMYELAVRHATRKPVVCVVENSTKLPFDVITDRVIFYDDTMFSVTSAKRELSNMIEAAMCQDTIDNPIYRSMNDKNILETIDKEKDEAATVAYKYLIERFDKIERYLMDVPQRVARYNEGDFITPAPISQASIFFDRSDTPIIRHEIALFVRKKYEEKGIDVEISYSRSPHKDVLRVKNGNVIEILESLVVELAEKFALKDVYYRTS